MDMRAELDQEIFVSSGRSTCEKQDIKHVEENKMTEITLNCLIVPIGKLMNIPCIKPKVVLKRKWMVDAPASTSTSVTMTGNETVTLADEASEAFDDDFDYLYGIVTTATDWSEGGHGGNRRFVEG
ncbi:unnamed protein product [Rhizophagus irregularis]|nr:unnamed protein product [Rhizophagus irregularis]